MRYVVNNQATVTSGDSVKLCVPLTLDGLKFVPGEDYDLSATFKLTEATLDPASAFQKTTGSGITNSGDKAYLDIVYLDTQPYKDVMLYGGIVAQHVTTGKRHTVAKFQLQVEYDPQFELDASIPINTQEPSNTTARLLALLAEAALAPQVLTFPTFGVSQVPAANSIGINQAGLVAIGDGATVQGNSILPRRYSGHTRIDCTGKPKTGAAGRVFRIPFYVDELVVGNAVKLNVKTTYRAGALAVVNQLYFGLAWEDATAGSPSEETYESWHYANCHPTSGGGNISVSQDHSEMFVIAPLFESTPGFGVLDFDSYSQVCGFQQIFIDGTDPMVSHTGASFVSSYDFNQEIQEGEANALWLMAQIGNADGGTYASGSFFVSYDVTVEVIPFP